MWRRRLAARQWFRARGWLSWHPPHNCTHRSGWNTNNADNKFAADRSKIAVRYSNNVAHPPCSTSNNKQQVNGDKKFSHWT